ncbi:MAG: hypothetical protein AAF654_08770 [Myxococcota bacterium]
MSRIRRFVRFLTPVAAAVGAVACVVGTPWKRFEPPTGPVLVSITHAVLNPNARDAFDDYVFVVADAMDRGEIPGLVGYRIRKEVFGDEVWTMSAWRSAKDLSAFVRSEVHARAIRAGRGAIVTMTSKRVTLSADEIPLGWDRAEALLADS